LTRSFPHKLYRVGGITLVVLAGVFALLGEIFSRHYKALIVERLPALSAKATDSLYHITIEDIRINIITRGVTVYGLRMQADLDVLQRRRAQGRPPRVILDVNVPVAHIGGVRWKDLSTERALRCRFVAFERPKIRVQVMREWEKPEPRRTSRRDIEQVAARRIIISDPELDVRYSYGGDGFIVQSQGGRIEAEDWNFHPGRPFDSTRFFAAARASVELRNVRYTYPDALYRYDMDRISFDTRSSGGLILGMHIRPGMSYDSVYQRLGFRRDIYDCRLPVAALHGLNWQHLLTHHELLAKSLDLDTPEVSIYLSKRPPVNNMVAGPALFPHQRLLKMNLPLGIDAINISDGTVRYTEQHAATGLTGSLEFNYLRGVIAHVSNRPADIAQHPEARAALFCKFMHRSDMAGILDLRLADTTGAFRLNGRVRNLSASQIRPAVNAMAVADIASLDMVDGRLQIAGNRDSSWGTFAIRYNKLKVRLQKWDADDSDVHSRVLLSFLANKLLLYQENPAPGEPLRVVTTQVPRGNIRSFFLMLWRNIYQACAKTAIREAGAYDIVKRKVANKGKPKQRFFKGLFKKRRR
jgi:hypothetical protein